MAIGQSSSLRSTRRIADQRPKSPTSDLAEASGFKLLLDRDGVVVHGVEMSETMLTASEAAVL